MNETNNNNLGKREALTRPQAMKVGIVIAILAIGLTAGALAVRTFINSPQRAQVLNDQNPDACRPQSAKCFVEDEEVAKLLAANPESHFVISLLENGTEIKVGSRDQKLVEFSPVSADKQYECKIQILDKDGNEYKESACKNTVTTTNKCVNCACDDWGQLVKLDVPQKPNDHSKYIRFEWQANNPTPACVDDSQNCSEVRIFAEEPNAPGYDNFISKYSCTDSPAPTIRLHQANGESSRIYKAYSFNNNGDLLQGCFEQEPFSCADIPSCSLEEFTYLEQYSERYLDLSGNLVENPNNPLTVVDPVQCDGTCKFEVFQNGQPVGSDKCVDLGTPLTFDYNSHVNNPHINFDDDRDGDIWNELTGQSGTTNHTYLDAGVYELKLNCDTNRTTSKIEFFCAKRLTIGCADDGPPPSPTATPTPPELLACPVDNFDVQIALPKCEDCLLSPTVTPAP